MQDGLSEPESEPEPEPSSDMDEETKVQSMIVCMSKLLCICYSNY